ncbi:Rho GTPase-activating protein 1-5 like protein [Aduncisulcus paluster]|uniref:Rho GTPase-activating protein 1-5 like protein n=1 Tax=Aduncisulcus paluster TaxID=2918883 RepID=A0ABQ5KVE2_9EUKA|nr:Rho GTPase-activating protein 1-5 like protein [Aduncisulcus paluster]
MPLFSCCCSSKQSGSGYDDPSIHSISKLDHSRHIPDSSTLHLKGKDSSPSIIHKSSIETPIGDQKSKQSDVMLKERHIVKVGGKPQKSSRCGKKYSPNVSEPIKMDRSNTVFRTWPPHKSSLINVRISGAKNFLDGALEVPRGDSVDYTCGFVPVCLVHLQNQLIQHDGLKREGIFRVPSDKSKVESYIEKFDRGELPTITDPFLCANLILKYFQYLPSSLFSPIPASMIRKGQPLGVMTRLSEVGCSIAEWILQLCVHVSLFSDSNSMNLTNIAICIAPVFYDCSTQQDVAFISKWVPFFRRMLEIKAVERRAALGTATPIPSDSYYSMGKKGAEEDDDESLIDESEEDMPISPPSKPTHQSQSSPSSVSSTTSSVASSSIPLSSRTVSISQSRIGQDLPLVGGGDGDRMQDKESSSIHMGHQTCDVEEVEDSSDIEREL